METNSNQEDRASTTGTVSDELDSDEERIMENAAAAMTRLVESLEARGSGEKNLLKIVPFKGDGTEDPVDWINEFECAAAANGWSEARKVAIAQAYMKDNAEDWLQGLEAGTIQTFSTDDEDNQFKHLFLEQFKTTKKKAIWQQEFFNLKQGNNTVDTYVAKFKKLQRKVDFEDNFPDSFIIQLFVKGL